MNQEDLLFEVKGAYLKARSHVYYDKRNLHNRRIFAEFEASGNRDNALAEISIALSNNNPLSTQKIRSWIGEVKFITLPKSINNITPHGDLTFNSNIDLIEKYEVDGINYFIDCPAQLHIISSLWLMTAGVAIDRNLSSDCYGYRLHHDAKSANSRHLFEFYVTQYTKWRNQSTDLTKRTVSKDKQPAWLIGLDIRQFFYHTQVNWQLLIDHIVDNYSKDDERFLAGDVQLAIKLTKIVEAICRKYQKITEAGFSQTHKSLPKDSTPLPLEITFSPVIANWCLRDLDRAIRTNLRPIYYGRYVDDFLFVIPGSDTILNSSQAGGEKTSFIKQYFEDTNLINKSGHDEYCFTSNPEFKIQNNKFNLLFFHPKGSLGALEKFSKNIRRITSEFRFLPEVFPVNEIESLSHSISYQGSTNSLRNLKGFEVDKWELAKLLASAAAIRLYVSDTSNMQIEAASLEKIFHGSSGLNIYDLWERAFAILLLGGQFKQARNFYWSRRKSIQNILLEGDDEITKNTIENLIDHLDLSFSISLAIIADPAKSIISWEEPWTSHRDYDVIKKIRILVHQFKESNLIRHHYIASPLINFTSDRGDWTRTFSFWNSDLELIGDRIDLSPRYLHEEEFVHAAWMKMRPGENRKSESEAYRLSNPIT